MDEIYRTLSVLKQMADGRILRLPIGMIGMGEDMTIGFILTHEDGTQTIGGLSTLDLKQLNQLLNKYEIGFSFKDN